MPTSMASEREQLQKLDQAFETDIYAPVEGTKTAEVIAERKAHDALYHRLRHEVIAGYYNLDAFNDWVSELNAEAEYSEEKVRYDRKVDFEPEESGTAKTIFSLAHRRLDSQYTLDRSVLKYTRRNFEKAKKTIRKKVEKYGGYSDYFVSVNKLDFNYRNQLYGAERREVDLSTPVNEKPQGIRGSMEMESRARTMVAANLNRMRASLLPQGPQFTKQA
jgi:hypothetical protein